MTRVDRFELLTAAPARETLHAEAMKEEHPDMFEDKDQDRFQTLSRRTFGPFRRYCLSVCRDRFEAAVYIVTDAETLDEYDLPAVIRIADTEAEALAAIEMEA